MPSSTSLMMSRRTVSFVLTMGVVLMFFRKPRALVARLFAGMLRQLGLAGPRDDKKPGHARTIRSEAWDDTVDAELRAAFTAACNAPQGSSLSVATQLELYGLYKQANAGPCSKPEPSMLSMEAHSKWVAWHGLGRMSRSAAMRRYVATVAVLGPPNHAAAGATASKQGAGKRGGGGGGGGGGVGQVVSTMAVDKTSPEWDEGDDPFYHAGAGDLEKLKRALEREGAEKALDATDDEGRTVLHFACDGAHVNMVQYLLSRGANPNLKDGEGMTPLFYAVICDHTDIALLLLENNADPDIENDDGETARAEMNEDMKSFLRLRGQAAHT